MLRPILAGLAIALTLQGCASSGSGSSESGSATPRLERNVILGDRLAAADATNLYNAISRVQASYLTARSTSSMGGGGRGGRGGRGMGAGGGSAGPRVMVDDVASSLDDLRGIVTTTVAFVRYVPASSSGPYLSGTSQADVLYVVTKGYSPRFPLKER